MMFFMLFLGKTHYLWIIKFANFWYTWGNGHRIYLFFSIFLGRSTFWQGLGADSCSGHWSYDNDRWSWSNAGSGGDGWWSSGDELWFFGFGGWGLSRWGLGGWFFSFWSSYWFFRSSSFSNIGDDSGGSSFSWFCDISFSRNGLLMVFLMMLFFRFFTKSLCSWSDHFRNRILRSFTLIMHVILILSWNLLFFRFLDFDIFGILILHFVFIFDFIDFFNFGFVFSFFGDFRFFGFCFCFDRSSFFLQFLF